MTIHSSQGLTIENPRKVWIVNDFLSWSNLIYLALSRVRYLEQIGRVWCPRQLAVKSLGRYNGIIPRLTWETPKNAWKHRTLITYDRIFDNKQNKKVVSTIEGMFNAEEYKTLVIVRDEATFQYNTFADRNEFFEWYLELPPDKKHIHEVVLGHRPQRIKFDLDMPFEERADSLVKKLLDEFLNAVLDEFRDCYHSENVLISRDDIVVADSSGPLPDGGFKHSYHVILVPYCVNNNEEAEYFTARVLDRLNPEIAQYVDFQVNKCVQNFRIAESSKVESSRVKTLNGEMAVKLGTRHATLGDSMISVLSDNWLPFMPTPTPEAHCI